MRKFVVILSLFLCACSLGGYSKNSTFYMMNSDNLSAVSQKKLNIAVARVRVPDLLDKSQIVLYDKDSQEVEILEFERWGEPLPYVLQNTVTNDLQQYLPQSFVKSVEFASETLDYTIEIKINKIEAYAEDKVILFAWWHIENREGKIIHREQIVAEAAVEGNEIADIVKAQNMVIHEMSKKIALKLSKI